MPLSVEQFVQQLTGSGLLAEDELSLFRQQMPQGSAEQLARELVRQRRLTAFQAQQAYAGKAKTLVLGNYVVLDKLGQGGMGLVLKAEHRRMKRLVALKVLSPGVTKTKEAIARFHREVQAVARLEHPNIVSAYDADEASGTHFFVMQYVDGQDLSSLVKSKGTLTVEQTVGCLLQAAKGLQFAHAHGVIHRDVKPANLLLDSTGTVKILDLGLARIEGDTGAQAEITNTGAVMGTVDYMAPEQARNTKSADARSDIYSLGITLWYLLVGKAAYEGQTLTERLLAHQSDPIPSLCAARTDVPAGLDAVFQRMIAKRPADRYQSLTDVIAALEGCQRGEAPAVAPLLAAEASEDSQFNAFLAGLAQTDAGLRTGGTSAAPATRMTTDALPTMTNALPESITDPQVSQPRPKRAAVRPAAAVRPWWTDRKAQAAGVIVTVLLLGIGLWWRSHRPTRLDQTVAGINDQISTKPVAQGTGTNAAESSADYVPDGPAIDLFPNIDVTQGGVSRLTSKPHWSWSQDRRQLLADTSNADIAVPINYPAPEAYAIDLRLTPQKEGRSRRAAIGLRQGAQKFWLDIDRADPGRNRELGPWTGLGNLGGQPSMRNETSIAGTHLVPQQTLAVHIKVCPIFVRVLLDGQPAIDYRGPLSRLSNDTPAAARNDALGDFWLSVHEKTNIESMTLTPLRLSKPLDANSLLETWTEPRFGEWTPLFNGRDLSGWQGDTAAFSVQGGVLVANGRNASLTTTRTFADFEAELEFRQPEGAHCNFGFRSPPAGPIYGLNVQLVGGEPPGSLTNESCGALSTFSPPLAQAFRAWPEWNRLRVTFLGTRLAAELNGTTVIDATTDQLRKQSPKHSGYAPSGPLSLVLFKPGADFRNIRVREAKWDAAALPTPGEAGSTPSLKSTNVPTPTWPFDPPDGQAYRWSPPENLGPGINSRSNESVYGISGDGLMLTWIRNGLLHMSRRGSLDEPFSAPILTNEDLSFGMSGSITADGLVVVTDQNTGKQDELWMGTRLYLSGKFDWQRMSAPVNADGNTMHPVLSADGLTLLATSTRKAGWGDLWMFTRRSRDQPFGAATRMPTPVSSENWDMPGFVSNDRRMLIVSEQKDPTRIFRLFMRSTAEVPFEPGTEIDLPLGASTRAVLNGGYRLSSDGRTLFFHTPLLPNGQGQHDIWKTRRVRVASAPAAPAPPTALAPFTTAQAAAHQNTWAKHLGVPTEYTNSLGMKFRLIPPGEFLQGSPQSEINGALRLTGRDLAWKERIEGEAPQHRVRLPQPYYLGVHEITQQQYEQIVGRNPAHYSKSGQGAAAVEGLDTTRHPVESVSWRDVELFCRTLSERERLAPALFNQLATATSVNTGYRLPTESQWEFACRAGTTTRFVNGDTDADVLKVAWTKANSKGRTHPVGWWDPNPFGLYDLHGNVWEWTLDSWDVSAYRARTAATTVDPRGATTSNAERVVRGGDQQDEPGACRSAHRGAQNISAVDRRIGFRLALPVEAVKQLTSTPK